MRKYSMMAVALLVTVGTLATMSTLTKAESADDAVIKKVMKAAMKGGLCKKVIAGKASDKEKEDLLKMFKDLHEAKRVFGNMRNLGRGESPRHDVDHGQMDHCFRRTCVEFIVLAHPPKPSQPCEGALHDPATGQELESFDVVASLHDL